MISLTKRLVTGREGGISAFAAANEQKEAPKADFVPSLPDTDTSRRLLVSSLNQI